MARSDQPKRPRASADGLKPPADQVDEIRKLVADAQGKLDQVSRALASLGERVRRDRGPKG